MALPKLSENTYVSLSLAGMIVSLAFWVGGLGTTVTTHSAQYDELKKELDKTNDAVVAIMRDQTILMRELSGSISDIRASSAATEAKVNVILAEMSKAHRF